MINTPTIKEYVLNADKTPMIHSAVADGFTQYHMQTFDQSVLGLLRDGLITEEEALKNCNNPNELSLKLKGIMATSDRTWRPVDQEREAGGASAEPPRERPARSNRS
jgi:twitching motility protein PilT